jgi:acetyl esterase
VTAAHAPTEEVRAFLQVLDATFPRLGTEVRDATQARALTGNRSRVAGRPLPRVRDLLLAGAPPVRARCYWPEVYGDPLPAVVFFHGGGFVLCDLDSHDAICRDLAAECRVVVVSIGYRRAPEDPYPAAMTDAYAATCSVVDQADALNIDPARIAVAGDSAGGNLAAAVALRSRDLGGPSLCGQVLLYPMLDPAQNTPSYRQFGEGYFVTAEHLRWYWDCYRGSAEVDSYLAPPAAASLAGLPPALVAVAGCDPLADEGRAYAQRLADDGTTTTLVDAAGLFHGFLGFAAQLSEVATVAENIYTEMRALLRVTADPESARK